MATGTGRSAQFGISVPETTYGTYVAPTGFLPMPADGGEGFERNQENLEIDTLRSDSLVISSDMVIQTTRNATGSVALPFYRKGMGKLLNLLHANTVTPTQVGTTGAYTQTHNIGLSNPSRSATVQIGRDTVDGTTRAFNYVGCKVTDVGFSCDVGERLSSDWTFDGRDETTAEALVTATYPTSNIPFVFTQGTVEIDDVALTDCVRSFSLSLSIAQDVDRYCLDSSGLKKAPLVTGVDITGSLTLEFASMTQHTAFTSASNRKLELLFSGATIGGTEPYRANFVIPRMRTLKASPQVGGPDLITYDMEFRALYNGTDAPLTVTYQSTDTAL